MQYNRRISYDSVADALDAEALLLEQVACGKQTYGCFAWSANQCLVVPRKFTRLPLFEETTHALALEGWPVYVRQTGGGVTPQGPEILNTAIAVTLSKGTQLSIRDSYQLICGPIIDELKRDGVTAYCSSVASSFCDGDFNVVVDGKKLAGTAQRWVQSKTTPHTRIVFAHALILVNSNISDALDAVNRFHNLLQLDEQFEADVHCNYVDLLAEDQAVPSQEALSQRLLGGYRRMLVRASGIYDANCTM